MNKVLIALYLSSCAPLFGGDQDLLCQMRRANAFYDATLYENALPLYLDAEQQLTWHLLEGQTLDHIRSQIGRSYFYLHQDAKAAAWLSPASSNPTHILLLAAAQKNLGFFEEAISTLHHQPLGDKWEDDIQFSLGTVHYLNNQPAEAQKHLLTLIHKIEKPHLQTLALLYLARIEIEEKNVLQAEKYLTMLSTLAPQEGALSFEIAYLKGKAAFQKQDYPKAIVEFTAALPKKRIKYAPWYTSTLYQLGWSYLKLANEAQTPLDIQKQTLKLAEETFKTLSQHTENEHIYLALAESLIEQAFRFKDSEAYDKANTILANPSHFTTLEGQAHALFLRAEMASTYEARNRLYHELTRSEHIGSSYYAKGWYLRGINDFDEGISLKFAPQRANKLFLSAAESFRIAFELLKDSDSYRAVLAVKYQAEAQWRTNQTEAKIFAIDILNDLIHGHHALVDAHPNSEDIYTLRDRYAALLAQEEETAEDFSVKAEEMIKETLANFPRGQQTDTTMHLLGTHYFHQGKYAEAEFIYASLAQQLPDSPLTPEALLSASYCAEKQKKDKESIRHYRRQIFENYSSCSIAPLAYFLHYTFQEYLQGDRGAVKHLHNFKHHFADSPYLITAYYLIGIDYKRDRKTPEGKWIRKKNYSDAIEALSEAENIFNQHYTKGIIPKDSLPYFIQIRYRTLLDKALINYAIAEESEGTKRHIYLEYTAELLQQIHQELELFHHPLASLVTRGEAFAPLHEECCFWLAQTYLKANNIELAKQTLAYMLEKYKASKITDGYYLSRAYYEQGMLAMQNNDYEQAWRSLMQAEAAAKEQYLSSEQKLDLWIQQSLCYKALNQMDQAMLILSKAINNDAASGLRLKAMYMRAEIYELQGRFELARKQLEATSRKGGEWALMAKQKLEQEYGYD